VRSADVYQAVADKCSEKISRLAAKGDDMAKIWIGKIDRKVAKRNVMTTPYGAKLYGMKEQLLQEINERDDKLGYRYLGDDIEGDNFKACTYLANIMTDAIGETVIAAKKAMGWLQQVATISTKANIPIEWTTPIGFTPFQEYQTQELTRVSTFWGGVRVRLGLVKNTGKLDRRKQASGISPNFVHSCDASHLMMTVLRCLDKGLTDFSLIHDSYGTHACDVDILAHELREAFIQQYTEHDVLEEFREAIIKKLPQDLAEEIPPVPNKGKLDLNAVRDSLYFFA
jgi:DNA-directed RNA polymerase